ncbi:hypothetical protein DICPUDRAFT_51887 [Dictyostelium purpureum]|uniref:Transmembrane protein n=1 Tax=Dictyostelium purpureum TaxID=5786 RepID=F1A607_DICPU|nr:uncharacterized protein DICPUDRAFT_51887 [Dictyostelium purpureum]EGC28371.1 hypothetical protein DICPUDRAFT_51887 [Dictyostelium purpureum]|eukprot:XP_003295101.1 hypothetical protein DICPUDRAFT_51887 [Dictyostelium purpureum]
MGAIGKTKIILWLGTIVLMLAGSLGMIIYNKPLELQGLGTKSIAGKVWFNAVIALHAIYLIGVGFEIISRTYLMMVGSTCSEQRRGFLCCFVYSMSTWWKLMVILGVISFIILAGLTALIIALEGFAKIKIIRLAITDAVSLVQILFSTISFVTSRKTQRVQDEEEEALHGAKKPEEMKSQSTTSSPSTAPPCMIVDEKPSQSPILSKSSEPSAVLPA